MIAQYEIFKKLKNKQVCWVESATTLEDAKNRLRDLSLMFPADYFIFDAANRVFVVPAENPKLPGY